MTNDVKIFAKTIEPEAKDQIDALASNPVSDGSKVRIMPDVHAGAGCTIGTTMTVKDRICPNLVGVDIGCGMLAVKLRTKYVDLEALDRAIRRNVPSGFNIHRKPQNTFDLNGLRCPVVNMERAQLSIGTLGGGNHFIEVDKDKAGGLWLVIHSGSRHLGLEIANWYQKLAEEKLTKPSSAEIGAVIKKLKEAGRQTEIAAALKELKAKYSHAGSKDLAFLTGQEMEDYLNDMRIAQEYAANNRLTIADEILSSMKIAAADSFHTVHNYIDMENMILRKGAVSAYKGEMLLIPMNMRDGSLLCIGKGNEDWNCSAPHGAGRLMSRKKAKESITLGEYRESMAGIKSTCINFGTLDEAPAAYKPMSEIVKLIGPTCSVDEVIKPIYNFKASS